MELAKDVTMHERHPTSPNNPDQDGNGHMGKVKSMLLLCLFALQLRDP